MSEEQEKKKTIAEINGLMSELPLLWCNHLLKEAEKIYKMITAPPLPPTIKDDHGKDFYGLLMVHVFDEARQKALCGQSEASKFVSRERFEQLPTKSKCLSCTKVIKKLNGEGYNDFSWIQAHQKELILAIFHAGGQKTGVWISLDEVLPETKKYYKTRVSLLHGIKRLERRGIVERKLVKHRNHVRLTLACVKSTVEGHFRVSNTEIIKASLSAKQTTKDSARK
ncbi:MAG: hypothetical protein ACYSTT_16910 [Planctomycetota bacterium]|jgi:hypothetical protein